MTRSPRQLDQKPHSQHNETAKNNCFVVEQFAERGDEDEAEDAEDTRDSKNDTTVEHRLLTRPRVQIHEQGWHDGLIQSKYWKRRTSNHSRG